MANVGVWTDNWRGLKNAILLGRYYGGLTTFRKVDGGEPEDGGPIYELTGPFSNMSTIISRAYSTLRVGSGNTTPDVTDFALTSIPEISYLSVANENITYDTITGTAMRTVKLTIQNQSNSQVTIREWGLLGNCTQSVSSGILLYREVLETPVILDAYQSATLSVTLSITLADPV